MATIEYREHCGAKLESKLGFKFATFVSENNMPRARYVHDFGTLEMLLQHIGGGDVVWLLSLLCTEVDVIGVICN